MKEENIFKEVLFDFMRELPRDVDIGKLTVKEACDIINAFMEKHGLTVLLLTEKEDEVDTGR